MSEQSTNGRWRRWGVALGAAATGVAVARGYLAARRALIPPDERDPLHRERQGDYPERTHTPEPFARRYRQAIADDRMRAGLIRFQRHWRNARDTAFARYAEQHHEGEMGETYDQPLAAVGVAEGTGPEAAAAGAALPSGRTFEELRDELAAVKDRVLADLPHHFAEFKAAAERTGAVVYESASPEDANRYVAELCARKGVTLVSK